MQLLEIKSTISKMKNTTGWNNRRWESEKKPKVNVKTVREIIKMKQRKKKKIGKKWKVSVMHGTISSYLTHLEFES